MKTHRFVLSFLIASCAGTHEPSIDAARSAATSDARAWSDDGAPDLGSDGSSPDSSAPDTCPDGLVEDGAFCVGWRYVNPPQACAPIDSSGRGTPIAELVRTEGRSLAVRCGDEPLQVYDRDRDQWTREADVRAMPIETPTTEPPHYVQFVARGVAQDGAIVAIAGSLHGAAPFETWIAEPGAREWHVSIEAPRTNDGAGAAVSSSELLFVSHATAFVFERRPR